MGRYSFPFLSANKPTLEIELAFFMPIVLVFQIGRDENPRLTYNGFEIDQKGDSRGEVRHA